MNDRELWSAVTVAAILGVLAALAMYAVVAVAVTQAGNDQPVTPHLPIPYVDRWVR